MNSEKPSNVEFLAESQEIIEALNRDLISIEDDIRLGGIDPEKVNALFRSAHSLKGISSMFGLDSIARLAHEMETVLDGMRLGHVSIDAIALDVLFSCVEQFVLLIAEVENDAEKSEIEIDGTLKKLKQLSERQSQNPKGDLLDLLEIAEDVASVLTEYEEHRLRENVRQGRHIYILRTAFDLASFDVGLAEIDSVVKQLGEVITKLPSSKAGDAGTIAFDIVIGTKVSVTDLSVSLGDERIEIVPIRKRESSDKVESVTTSDDDSETKKAVAYQNTEHIRSVARTVRVDIRRLDRLMNLVGELGLTRMAFQRVSDKFRMEQGFTELAAELHKEGRNFERRLSELQAGIMEVRMVPLASLFERMVRIGRKVSRELGREVRIEVKGEQTDLDKLIVEDLADPLMHLIRNAIDHGIEPPNERVQKNKEREGLVRLTAGARGNHVVVEVTDDGRGIDTVKTIATATEKKIISADRANELTRREVFNLLLLPGFSTREQVSEYSGRGVGLDVVKTKISQLSGIIDIDSSEGQGTSISVTLPITLAIIPALIVKVAGQTYGIPLNNVQETLALEREMVRTIEKKAVISIRGTTIPLIDLREVFKLSDEQRPDACYGVIAGAGQNSMALVVDELVEQQDIVIKSLGRWLKDVPGISGAAELGNQKTILVIDLVELLTEISVGERGMQEFA